MTPPLSGAISPAIGEISVVLPDAGEADDGDELAFGDREVDAAEHSVRLAPSP